MPVLARDLHRTAPTSMIAPLRYLPLLAESLVNMELLLLRIIHVVGGVVWAGTGIFVAVFLLPAMGMAGPAGAPVMGALIKRRLFVIVPGIAVLTMLAGFRLLWLAAGGSGWSYLGSGSGVTYSIGSVAALTAFTIFMTVNRPALGRMGALQQRLAQTPEAERGPLMAEMNAIRGRTATASKFVALFLTVAAATMAVARYLV